MIKRNFGGRRRECVQSGAQFLGIVCCDAINWDGRKVGSKGCWRCYGCYIYVLVTCGRSTSCSAFSFQIPVNANKDADVVVAVAVAMGCRAGRDGRVRIVFGEHDGSTILVLPESFFSSSSIDIFSRYILRRRHRIESSNSSLLFFLRYRALPPSNQSIIPQQK